MWRARGLLLTTMATALAAAPAHGQVTVTSANLRIVGEPGAPVGGSVAALGDVNGDGRPDVAVGAPLADPQGRTNAGSVFVVFGQTSKQVVDVRALGALGFRIDGAQAGDLTGAALDGAGDVDGDRRPDLLIGAPGAEGGAGAAHLAYGKATTARVDLAAPGTAAATLRGEPALPGASVPPVAGSAVAGAGDLDGDGVPDLLVGAPGTVRLDLLGVEGARVGWPTASEDDRCRPPNNSGYSFFPCLALGLATYVATLGVAPPGPVAPVGAMYVVRGERSRSAQSRSLADRARTRRVVGATGYAMVGAAVDVTSDLSRDGRPDVLVGAPGLSGRGDRSRMRSGGFYVIHGGAIAGELDLRAVDTRGYDDHPGGRRVDGFAPGALIGTVLRGLGTKPHTPAAVGVNTMGGAWILRDAWWAEAYVGSGRIWGTAIGSAGDVNVDGRPDLLLAGPRDNAVTVAFLRPPDASFGVLDPNTLTPPHGYVIRNGTAVTDDLSTDADDFGAALEGIGDLNRDGTPDQAVGHPGHGPGGTVWLVMGRRG